MKKGILLFCFFSYALSHTLYGASEDKEDKPFDFVGMILEHVADSHEFHIADWGGHAISLPLPVILWTNSGLICFLSSQFKHDNEGSVVVEEKGVKLVRYHNKVYQLPNGFNELPKDTDGKITAEVPLDFSITKNVFSLFISSIFILSLFISMAKSYRSTNEPPRGIAKFLEPLVLFVRDDIVIPNIGEKKYHKFLPYLLTLFFFIWINNLVGLVPFFPFSSNLSGNIAFTLSLAFITLLLILFNGNKNFWGHIFTPKGVPWWVLPILAPIELIGVFTKPFALMIRLFANITAGHIIILSIVSIVFIYESYFAGVGSAIFLLFLNGIELLVAFIQAYIFTMLTSLFIGQAVEEAH